MVFSTVGDQLLRWVVVIFVIFLLTLFNNVVCVNAITSHSSNSAELERILGHGLPIKEGKSYVDRDSVKLERITGNSLGK